jgi:hypothetical protein
VISIGTTFIQKFRLKYEKLRFYVLFLCGFSNIASRCGGIIQPEAVGVKYGGENIQSKE